MFIDTEVSNIVESKVLWSGLMAFLIYFFVGLVSLWPAGREGMGR